MRRGLRGLGACFQGRVFGFSEEFFFLGEIVTEGEGSLPEQKSLSLGDVQVY